MTIGGQRSLARGLVLILVLSMLIAIIETSSTFKSSGESAIDITLEVVEVPPPAAVKLDTMPVPRETGKVLTIPVDPSPTGSDPQPSDPPFDPNVRVWGDTNEQSRPTAVINPINGRLYIAFQHFNGADWDIFLTTSEDSNSPWLIPVAMADTPANEENPSMAITSTGAFALFYQQDAFDDRIYFSHSTDGFTWSEYYLTIGTSLPLFNAQYPAVTAQNSYGSYPDGIMVAWQMWCTSTTHCGGGAHTIFWLGSQGWSNSPPILDLGGSYWLTDPQPGGNRIADPLRPSLSWSNSGVYQGMDEETVDGQEWRLLWFILPEDGSSVANAWISNARSWNRGIFSESGASGLNNIIAGTFWDNASSRSRIIYFHTSDGGAYYHGALLDTATTDQRSLSVAGIGTDWHITYYSGNIMTHQISTDSGANFNGAEKVSDNAGTAVNDDRATSVFIDSGILIITWQDDRDGDVNIYTTVGVGSQGGNDITGPRTKNQITIPNPYVWNNSTSLKVVTDIDDTHTGGSNITVARLVLTNQSVTDRSQVNWTNAWVMNLTGIDRRPLETAWLWANETAAGWPLDSCHRFWIRGRDNKGNWGAGKYVDICVIIPKEPRAATMTRAILSGSGHADVTLGWDRSPDDGGGSNEVTLYEVGKSQNPQGPFTVVANVTAQKSPFYTWTDAGAGHGNPQTYFYRIVAGTPYFDSPPSRLAAKFQRAMAGGKQLVSIPLEQDNYAISTVFQTFGYVYARTYVAGTPNPWWCHKPGRFINQLNELSVAQGYWVDVDGPGAMTVAGLVPVSAVVSLKSGWNMIGFPSFGDSYTFADLDADTGGLLQLVEVYDPAAGPYYLQKVNRNAWSTTYLRPGYAFMVRVSSDVNWNVPGS